MPEMVPIALVIWHIASLLSDASVDVENLYVKHGRQI